MTERSGSWRLFPHILHPTRSSQHRSSLAVFGLRTNSAHGIYNMYVCTRLLNTSRHTVFSSMIHEVQTDTAAHVPRDTSTQRLWSTHTLCLLQFSKSMHYVGTCVSTQKGPMCGIGPLWRKEKPVQYQVCPSFFHFPRT